MKNKSCPVCLDESAKVITVGPLALEIEIDCSSCGIFTLTADADVMIRNAIKADYDNLRAVLVYYIRRMQNQNPCPRIDSTMAIEFLKRKLPTAVVQADNLILWIGDNTTPGERRQLNAHDVYPLIGANLRQGLLWVIKSMQDAGLLEKFTGEGDVCLSFKGWGRYSELKKGRTNSKKAFMAMPFRDNRLREVYSTFRAAALLAGFTLETLDERPQAGVIDNRLRVEIQTSRFVVADLTGNNAGVYWEGGFAEGLGKPVFYTCEKAQFDIERTHFDANHLYTVVWKFDQLQTAADELKNAIRATLPEEAKMTDE
jgi:nucleoside 2-deoxyribosyltransferase